MLPPNVRSRVAADLNISVDAVAAIETHLSAGDPIPYIARRHADTIGALDTAALRRARNRLDEAKELELRRANLVKSLEALGDGEDAKKLRALAETATDRFVLDDVSAHQRKHKGTRGSEAMAKGLEPLADAIAAGSTEGKTLEELAAAYVSVEKGVATAQDALHGAAAILAERFAAEPEVRGRVRREMRDRGEIVSKVFDANKQGAERYKEFFDHRERGKAMAGRRYLKLRQGEREKVLKFTIEIQADGILGDLESKLLPALAENANDAEKARHEFLKLALRDAAAHILPGAIEIDVRTEWKERSDLDTINFLRKNVRHHCHRPPFGRRVVMGVDSMVRKGIRAAVVDAAGSLLAEASFALDGEERSAALEKARGLLRQHHVEAVAVSNESECDGAAQFLKEAIDGLNGAANSPEPVSTPTATVSAPAEPVEAPVAAEPAEAAQSNESAVSVATNGAEASQENANPAAPAPSGGAMPAAPELVRVPDVGAAAIANSPAMREEMGDHPVPVRAAVSMARRLQDPLAELVRVEPKILAGFHHGQDVAKGRLERMLHEEMESCVHEIPIDLNTAPAALLAWVGNMGMEHAKKIVEWRKANGQFPSRVALARVGLDETVYRRSVAFLRVYGGADPLDATGVHPDHAAAAEKLVKGANVASLGELTPEALGALELASLADEGSPASLLEHVRALLAARHDPRGEFVRTVYNSGVRSIGHLKPGQELQGIVRGIANFGVFVDVGVSQDGLLHVSELASHFVKDPSEIVKVGDVVKVRVLSIEPHKKKIALTMKSEEERQKAEQQKAEEREARRVQRLAARERARERRQRQAEAAVRRERAAQGLPPDPQFSGPQHSGAGSSGHPYSGPSGGRPQRPAPTPVRAATTRRDGVTGGKKRRGAPFDRARRDGRGRGGDVGDDLMSAEPNSDKAKSEAPPAPANPFKRFFQAHGLLES